MMDRREFLGVTTLAGLGIVAGGCVSGRRSTSEGLPGTPQPHTLQLLPYPQEIHATEGQLPLGSTLKFQSAFRSEEIVLAERSLSSYWRGDQDETIVRLGTLVEGYPANWLSGDDRNFLAASERLEASIVHISKRGITIIGKGRWGMLYGVQTINQLLIQASREKKSSLPCMTIRDWPEMKWRCLAPTLAWYSGWNRLEGYDLCNWSEGEWKWLADWSLLHKCNSWAVCMYGYWPFKLPGYEKETLDVDSFFYNPQTGQKEKHRFTHRNIQREFFPAVIHYANQRGVKVHAYIGKNSFNGRAFANDAALNGGGAAEMLPFAKGTEEYWDALISRILEMGFDGFVFEDPEANHVPNQNDECYKTFWEPWAQTYGFKSVQETDANNPPLGVHVEYYTWLFRTFDRLIQKHAGRLGKEPEVYLISHVLLARISNESKTAEERNRWFAMVDQKHGREVPFIITEDKERFYVDAFGGDRIASLGGRGGSCTNAMRRIASVNNDWVHGAMGADLAYERECQQRIHDAGGFGAMGYIFEWTNTEVFAYLAAQHLWRSAGIPGVSNTDQVGILRHAYRLYYGEEVGHLVARAMDEGSDVNDAMVLEDVHGSQWPFTGKALHRDFQFLAVLADRAEASARQAYRRYAGEEPALFEPVYAQDDFHWDGYDPAQDQRFKSERLRRLWLSTRRSQEMCQCALAHRLAQRLISQEASFEDVLTELDRAISFARKNQLIYQVNYDDDYDPTDGLCAFVTEKLEAFRKQFIERVQQGVSIDRKLAQEPVLLIPWKKLDDLLPAKTAGGEGRFMLIEIGVTEPADFFRVGTVFSVEQRDEDGSWKTIFRRAIHRREAGWQSWEIPLQRAAPQRQISLRLVTDCYTRAMDRSWPTWKWALWKTPRVVRKQFGAIKEEAVLSAPLRYVRLDSARASRPFDQKDHDSAGAAFTLIDSTPEQFLAVPPYLDGQTGVTIAEYEVAL